MERKTKEIDLGGCKAVICRPTFGTWIEWMQILFPPSAEQSEPPEKGTDEVPEEPEPQSVTLTPEAYQFMGARLLPETVVEIEGTPGKDFCFPDLGIGRLTRLVGEIIRFMREAGEDATFRGGGAE